MQKLNLFPGRLYYFRKITHSTALGLGPQPHNPSNSVPSSPAATQCGRLISQNALYCSRTTKRRQHSPACARPLFDSSCTTCNSFVKYAHRVLKQHMQNIQYS